MPEAHPKLLTAAEYAESVKLSVQIIRRYCREGRKRPNLETYSCTIHNRRPDVCREYPVTLEQAIKDGCPIANRMPMSELIPETLSAVAVASETAI
jgi:Fe-S-cluster containining protein